VTPHQTILGQSELEGIMLRYAVLAAALLAVTPAVAGSKCSTKMLEGEWYADIDVQGNGGATAVLCPKLKFDKEGNVASSSCREDYYNEVVSFQGQLTVSKSCLFKGSFRLFVEGKDTKRVAEFNGVIDANGNLLMSLLMSGPKDYYDYQQSRLVATRKD